MRAVFRSRPPGHSRTRLRWPLAFLSFVLVAAGGCRDRDLRGWSESSPDGASYLVVEAVEGPECEQLLVDGSLWQYGLGNRGPLAPGRHEIACGSAEASIEFSIRPGTTFHFEYWGP